MSRLRRCYYLLPLLMLGGCVNEELEQLREANMSLSDQLSELRQEADARDRYAFEISQALEGVTALMDQLLQEELAIGRLVAQAGAEGVTFTRDQSIMSRLETLNDYLQRNAETISELEARLAAVPQELAELQKTVAWLRIQNQRIEQRAADHLETIGALQRRVRDLSGLVEEHEQTIEAQSEVIAEQQTEVEESLRNLEAVARELRTGFYVVGHPKQLVEAGILERSKRRTLRLRRRLRLSARVEALQSRFTSVRIDETGELALGTKPGRIELVPDRSPSTYRVVNRGAARYVVITNPDEFWVSRYLVVAIR